MPTDLQIAGPVHVIGASGRSGQAIVRALLARDIPVVPIIRNPSRWPGTGLPGTPLIADVTAPGLEKALEGATAIVSTAHARTIPFILSAAPPGAHFVFLGSTRKFTRWPDAHGKGVIEGEDAFHASGRPGALLHPTMIYGADGEDNVRRLATLIRRLPILPLPGGGTALVQPIHQSDLTRCILAALAVPWDGPQSLVVAGPVALPYADFVRAVAVAAGLKPPRIATLPALALRIASPITLLPFLPRVGAAELRRLGEDKAFDISLMRGRLGIHPMPLAEGLARTFGTPPCP